MIFNNIMTSFKRLLIEEAIELPFHCSLLRFPTIDPKQSLKMSANSSFFKINSPSLFSTVSLSALLCIFENESSIVIEGTKTHFSFFKNNFQTKL